MLVQTANPPARPPDFSGRAGQKVRPEYPDPAPELGPYRTIRGFRVTPLADLVRMKLRLTGWRRCARASRSRWQPAAAKSINDKRDIVLQP